MHYTSCVMFIMPAHCMGTHIRILPSKKQNKHKRKITLLPNLLSLLLSSSQVNKATELLLEGCLVNSQPWEIVHQSSTKYLSEASFDLKGYYPISGAILVSIERQWLNSYLEGLNLI